MTNFIPETSKVSQEVPYFDDVTSEQGWQGHSTSKTIEALKSEVAVSISRLGGVVTGFQRGTFVIGERNREGFRVSYYIELPDGSLTKGRLDVAALPVKTGYKLERSLASRKDKSLRMALFMLRNALDGAWFLQQLSPGYAPLMPWMLVDGKKTITELWAESSVMKNLLPPKASDFDIVEGEYREK